MLDRVAEPMSRSVDFSTVRADLPRTEGILNLGPKEAYAYLTQGALLLDIRESYETNFRVFDVDEVLYLPMTKFAQFFRRIPADRPIIIADAAGIYAREAARTLAEHGYTNIAKLSGGMIDWHADGLPVRMDASFELGGSCACKIKTRSGKNPLQERTHRSLAD